MSQSMMSQISQKPELSDVRDVQVTEAVDDGTSGLVRAFRFYGEPSVEISQSLILEVQIKSDTITNLNITAPELDF